MLYQIKRKAFVGLCCCAIICLSIFFINNSVKDFSRSSTILKKLNSNKLLLWYNGATTTRSDPTIDFQEMERFYLINNKKNIFFHETSNLGDGEIVLTARKACAIESAAKMNPGLDVYLLVMSPLSNSSNSTTSLLKKLASYNNVFVVRIFMNDYVKETPLEDWWSTNVIKSSKWPESHISDILRYLTLWKYRGIYLDLDFVITKSLEHLTNFAGAENPKYVNSAALGFSSDELGQKIADACLNELKNNFRGDIWNQNGPRVITEILRKFCNTTNTVEMTVEKCQGFEVFPPTAFYPINWKYWKKFFTIENSEEVMKEINKSYGIHVWNHFSYNEVINVGSQVPYAVIANEYCPKVYNNCGKTF